MNSDTEELPCSNKIAFDNRQEADTAAIIARYRYGTILSPYRCQYCGLWHLTSIPSSTD